MVSSTTPWTAEAIDYLRKRAAESWSSGRISEGLRQELGLDISYNAVIGKANREGIKLIAHLWPEAATKILLARAEEGICASAIARELQSKGFAFSRRQVRDKARTEKVMLALELKRSVVVPIVTQRWQTRTHPVMMQRLKASKWMEADDAPLPSSRPINLVELRNHMCKWPLGRNADGDRMFCGAFKLSGTYCPHHLQISIATEERIQNHGQEERLAG